MTERARRSAGAACHLLWLVMLCPVVGAAQVDEAIFEGTPLPPAARVLVIELTTCAAYYFNATRARPLRDYERLYGAGERVMNRALRLLDRARVDRLIGDASIAMTALTGGDWRNFHRVEHRHAAACAELEGAAD